MEHELNEFGNDYEEMIDKLSTQINQLFSEINYYQALITEKDSQIIRLTAENSQLKLRIQNLSKSATPPSDQGQKPYLSPTPKRPSESPPPDPSQESYTPPPPKQHPPSTVTSGDDTRIMKRQCPECGAMGFAIKEVDDRTKVISFSPHRIYAKKMVCTKCRNEF